MPQSHSEPVKRTRGRPKLVDERQRVHITVTPDICLEVAMRDLTYSQFFRKAALHYIASYPDPNAG
jgi:hypothetical protein